VSFRWYTPDGRDIRLGPTVPALHAFQRFAELDAGDAHQHIHGMPHCGDEQLDTEFVAALADEARRFLAEHASELDDYQREALRQFARADEPAATERR
jgi:hypothetical protein